MAVLSGTALAAAIRQSLRESLPLVPFGGSSNNSNTNSNTNSNNNSNSSDDSSKTTPSLLIIQHGSNPASSSYIRMKIAAALDSGIHATHLHLPLSSSLAEILSSIRAANEDSEVHGILVQLPLALTAEEQRRVISSISPHKDVDGFSPESQAAVHSRLITPPAFTHTPHLAPFVPFTPCTPRGILSLLQSTGVVLRGLHAVVLGRSDIVGSPLAGLLKQCDMTVTHLHRYSNDVSKFVGMADLVVAAIGQPAFVKGEWIKRGAIVIDVGTNFVPDATKKSGHRLVGDVEYEVASQRASWITPVPGGVGPMTVASLMQNTFIAAQQAVNAASQAAQSPVVKPAADNNE